MSGVYPGALIRPDMGFSNTLLIVPTIEVTEQTYWLWGRIDSLEISEHPSIVIAFLPQLFYGTDKDNFDDSHPVYVVSPQGVGWLSSFEVRPI